MFAELPVGAGGSRSERVHSLHEQMQGVKQVGSGSRGGAADCAGCGAPAMLLALGGGWRHGCRRAAFNTVTANVPGPQYPLYLAQRRSAPRRFRFSSPWEGTCGLASRSSPTTAGSTLRSPRLLDTAPDIGVLCRAIESGVAEPARRAIAETRQAASPRGRTTLKECCRSMRVGIAPSSPTGSRATIRQTDVGPVSNA